MVEGSIYAFLAFLFLCKFKSSVHDAILTLGNDHACCPFEQTIQVHDFFVYIAVISNVRVHRRQVK